jgi:acetyl esterase
MRRTGSILRRMPGASIATATDAQIARSSSGAHTPEFFASLLQGAKPRGVSTEDRTVQDGTVEGIPIRIYRRSAVPALSEGSTARKPLDEESTTRRPLVVYFHGGGFVLGDLRGGDWLCGTVAKALDAVVVSVDYRLAPKHPFPAAIDGCFAATVWASRHAEELGADADRLGIMGESAGGNLAAVIALMARNNNGPRIRHQALLYPSVGAGDTESRRRNADAFILTAADMKRFGELYAGDPTDWRVSPIAAESFAALPPALIEVAEHDPLHDDGVLYAEKLRSAGVPVRLINFPAMPHGFLNFPRFAKDAKPGVAEIVKAQRAALR